MTLAQLIKSSREDRKLSYKRAAAGIGISQSTLHDIEHGAMPRLDTAVRMARFYELPITRLAELAEAQD